MSTASSSDRRYMELAIREAYKSNMYTRHGCVIVVNGKTIGRGHNSNRTAFNDGFVQGTCSCHAEMAALRNAFKEKKCIGTMFSGQNRADINKHRFAKVANPQHEEVENKRVCRLYH